MINSCKMFSTEDVDKLFRQTDFSSDNFGFKSQLRNRFKSYSEEDTELTSEELLNLAAAKSDLLPKKSFRKDVI